MAHVLLGWELGGGRGHIVPLLAIAKALRAEGHRISFAVQRVDSIRPDEALDSAVWQAPLTPRLLINAYRPRTASPRSMGDILARIGCDDAHLVEAVLRAWATLLDALCPDLVIGEFAPFMLLEARQRCPTIAIGSGFSTPPAAMKSFPALAGDAPALDEEATLAAVNRALARLGRPPLTALPELFAVNRSIAASFAELDPYARWRSEPHVAPPIGELPEPASGFGEEVFVYAPERLPPNAPLWRGLAAANLPVRVHVKGGHQTAELAAHGFAVEPEPVPFSRIAERARLLVSHGGRGFASSALVAGLPQIVCHYDLEKQLSGRAIARLGLGGHVALGRIQPEPFAAALLRIYGDDALAERARQAAPIFRARCRTSLAPAVAKAVDELT